MSLELTTNDLLILEKQRLERLRSFFADSLRLCFIHINQNNVLTIHCSQPWIVDHLLDEIQQLRWYAWVIAGAQQISICFAQEEVYRTATRRPIKRAQRIHCS